MEITRDILIKLANENTDFVIATIVAHQGSTPRSTGTKMVVYPDGRSMGTIGGGTLEANVIEQSLITLRERKRSTLHSYQFTGKDAASMDMICGGEVTVMLTYIPSHAEKFLTIQHQLKKWEDQGETFLEISGCSEDGTGLYGGINLSTGEEIGWIPDKETWMVEARSTFTQIRGISIFSELHQPVTTVYIFGAGHVGQAVALFAKPVGFRVVVIDDREEFANSDRFPQADEILVTPSITEIFQQRRFKPTDYLVIVTRGHLQDYQVLEQALQTQAGYIGMIGSRRKNQLIFQSLREKGFSEEAIQRVFAPIGLAIGAETPEEIGISILAEMIQFRARQRNH